MMRAADPLQCLVPQIITVDLPADRPGLQTAERYIDKQFGEHRQQADELTAGHPASEGEVPGQPGANWTPATFTAALDDDLAVPQALAVVHDWVRDGNNALASGDAEVAWQSLETVRAMLGVLGLDPLASPWAGGGADHDLREVVDVLVKVTLDQRQAARDRKDYDAADGIRDQLKAAGVFIEDTPEGPRWEIKR